MTEEELVAILTEEETDASSYWSSELAKAQADAMDRYYAKAYGDERADRSKVVTADVRDAINWMMPHLMRVFMSADERITCEAGSLEDDLADPQSTYTVIEQGQPVQRPCETPRVQLAGQYIDHVLFNDNPGERIIHDLIFDGALQRQGIVEVEWEDPKPGVPKQIEGLTPDVLAKYASDPSYEVRSQEQGEDGTFAIEVVHTPRLGKPRVCNVPPEQFLISRRAASIAEADYHGRKMPDVYVAELVRDFPDAARQLDPEGIYSKTPSEDTDSESDARLAARHNDEAGPTSNRSSGQRGRRKVTLYVEYVRIDFDGDGIVELRQIKRVGKTVLENIQVERSKFVAWSPIRVSHKVAGLSLADVLGDIQRIRTVIARRALDSLDQALTPQKVANTERLGSEGVDDLLDNDVGGVIRSKGDPRESVMVLTTPDVSASAFAHLEYWDQKSQEASGVTKEGKGLDPQAMNKTASGIDMLQAAALNRIELVARWAGLAVEEIGKLILHLVCAHQDAPRQVKVAGKWIAMDPRRWSDEMAVRVHVGQAGLSKAQQISNLLVIAQKQEGVLLNAGPANPLVTLKQYRATLARLTEAMGFKDPSQFWGDIPDDYQPPPQQDPKQAEAAAKLQIEQAKAQSDAQLRQAELQHKTQLAGAEFQHKTQLANAQAQTDREIAGLKIAGEMDIARIRIAAETEIARERMQREDTLARWKAEREVDVAKMKVKAMSKGKRPKDQPVASSTINDGADVRMGGQIG